MCNLQRWYEFIGDIDTNPMTPFRMIYVYDIADIWDEDPWNEEAKKCSEPYDVSLRKMSSLNNS